MRTMDPSTVKHASLSERLDLEADGQLSERERWQLGLDLAGEDALVRERQELEELGRLLAASKIAVRPGFAQQITKNLPAAGWEAKSPANWRFVAALLVLLAGLSAALVGTGSARMAPESSFLGAAGAVADLFRAAALAGAGLLSASWRGLGLAMGEMVRGSWVNWVALGLVVVGANALLILQLRSRPRPQPVSARGEGTDPR